MYDYRMGTTVRALDVTDSGANLYKKYCDYSLVQVTTKYHDQRHTVTLYSYPVKL